MNNYAFMPRSAATATVAACLFTGHAVQVGPPRVFEKLRPEFRFDLVKGSMSTAQMILTQLDPTTESGGFAKLVDDSYFRLAQRQRSLAHEFAQTLMDNAWNLYEEA